ncbi:hypothetical protein [Christiangramia sp. SM2212]|uniref:Uncharacterized protein n=1 Tax=Christiangramia sediminicola TaxID=3073267 RepID=A0ABU1ET42_9FLAO|nr:hypothetical protein [Christiangramia sp. SM2212]MDR5591571.1 hypothetical protein [Christiangramia sp. SM2212]
MDYLSAKFISNDINWYYIDKIINHNELLKFFCLDPTVIIIFLPKNFNNQCFMKNYFIIVAILGLLFMGCTVDNDELNYEESYLNTFNLEASEICEPYFFDLIDSGNEFGSVILSNSNDGETAFVEFEINMGYSLSEILILKANDVSAIPASNGGVIPGKLDKYDYNSIGYSKFEFSVESSMVLVARITVVDENGRSYVSWVGSETLNGWKNGSAYLTYNVCIPPNEPVCNVSAGSDVSISLTNTYVLNNLYTPARLGRYLIRQLDAGVSTTGTFDPDPEELINMYLSNNFQTFTTTYTVTGDDCSDSAVFKITVEP